MIDILQKLEKGGMIGWGVLNAPCTRGKYTKV